VRLLDHQPLVSAQAAFCASPIETPFDGQLVDGKMDLLARHIGKVIGQAFLADGQRRDTLDELPDTGQNDHLCLLSSFHRRGVPANYTGPTGPGESEGRRLSTD
jgi:hypothetical protein